MDIQCQICKSTFLKTTRAPQYVASVLPETFCSAKTRLLTQRSPRFTRLEVHAQNKHSKTIADCFPGYTAA